MHFAFGIGVSLLHRFFNSDKQFTVFKNGYVSRRFGNDYSHCLGLSVQAEPMKERQGNEGSLEFLSLQIEGMRRQLDTFTPKVDSALMRDFAVDQNRSALIADLTILAGKAQKYCHTPATLTGGGNSFVGLTADASGLAQLASTAVTDNSNGKYTIKTAGTATSVVLHAVGKTTLNDGTFPTYDMTVTAETQVATKIN